jgi:peroxiredoxin
MALPVGSKAPDFTLKTKDSEGVRDVTLSDNFGKTNTVLLFFPGAFTHVCHQEMCDFTRDLESYTKLDATVYGITNDTPFVLEEWTNQIKIGFPLLSDFQKDVSKLYDVVWPDFAGLGPGTARAVFVIDREAVIRHSEQTPTLLDLPNYEAIENALNGLLATK